MRPQPGKQPGKQILSMSKDTRNFAISDSLLLAPEYECISKTQNMFIKDLLFEFLANTKRALTALFTKLVSANIRLSAASIKHSSSNLLSFFCLR